MSKQVIKSFFPDLALSKMKGHHIWTGIKCNDLSTALVFGQGTDTGNTFTIRMNASPQGGGFYYQPGTDTPSTDLLNPVTTYVSRYKKYRPMGCKVTVTVFSQDNGQAQPEGEVSNLQVATPFMLYGFPFVFKDETSPFEYFEYSNEWTGQPGSNFTADSIPQMKYGFRRISPGLGGKNIVKYTTYWDFAKLLGLTHEQYLADQSGLFVCRTIDGDPDVLISPSVGVDLCLALADYTPALARECSVDIKIVQYGRWEAQSILAE